MTPTKLRLDIFRETFQPRIPDVKLPEASDQPLWETDSKKLGDRVKLINEPDFNLGERWTALGVDNHPLTETGGLTNVDEIDARAELNQFLLDHPEVARKFESGELNTRDWPWQFPTKEADFLKLTSPEHGDHNAFWKKVHRLVEVLDPLELPSRLRTVIDHVKQGLVLEALEDEMSEVVAQNVQRVTLVEGSGKLIVTFTKETKQGEKIPEDKWERPGVPEYFQTFVRWVPNCTWTQREIPGVRDSNGHPKCEPDVLAAGHRMYSYAIDAYDAKKYPDWCKYVTKANFIWSGTIGWLIRTRIDIINHQRSMAGYNASRITTVSQSLLNDVRVAVGQKLAELDWTNPETPRFERGSLEVKFSYSRAEEGEHSLRVHICNFLLSHANAQSVDEPLNAERPFITEGDLAAIEKARRGSNAILDMSMLYRESAAALQEYLPKPEVVTASEGAAAGEVDGKVEGEPTAEAKPAPARKVNLYHQFGAPSPQGDRVYKYFALINVLNRKDFKPTVTLLNEYRSYIVTHLGLLRQVIGFVNAHVKLAQAEKLPLGVAIRNGDGKISLDGAVPIHLFEQHRRAELKKPKLVPFDLPALNGDVLGISGDNQGCKSTVCRTTAQEIYAALSGFPVFCRGAHYSRKSVVGISVVSDKDKIGSTSATLWGKNRALLKETRKVPGPEVLIIIDELGSNTDGEGSDNAQDVINTIAARKQTLIFTVQDSNVVRWAVPRFGAIARRADRERHTLVEGIGGGRFKKLVDDRGGKELLQKVPDDERRIPIAK